jgi:hypothetical protein
MVGCKMITEQARIPADIVSAMELSEMTNSIHIKCNKEKWFTGTGKCDASGNALCTTLVVTKTEHIPHGLKQQSHSSSKRATTKKRSGKERTVGCVRLV